MYERALARIDGALHEIDTADVEHHLARNSTVWYDLTTRDRDKIQEIGTRFGLNPAIVNDATGPEQLPKYNDFDDHMFVVLHGLALGDDGLDTTQINCVIGAHLFLTIAERQPPGVTWLWDAVQRNGFLDRVRPDELFGELAEVVGHRYFEVVAELDDRIDTVYDRALSADPRVLSEVQVLRRDATDIAKVLRPQRIVLNDLRRLRTDVISSDGQELIGDAFDVHNLVVESLRSARTLLADALDSYRGAVGDRQSLATTVLAVYSAIMLPLTFITGFYGMNVKLPGMNAEWAWIYIVVLMAIIAFGSAVVFVRSGFVSVPRMRNRRSRIAGLRSSINDEVSDQHRQARASRVLGRHQGDSPVTSS